MSENTSEQKKTIVLYHADLDGLAAAWVCWTRFKENAEYKAVQYNQPVPDFDYNGVDLYIVDFSYSLDILLGLKMICNSVKVIDHHKTAEKTLSCFEGAVYNPNYAGCDLTWITFYPGVEIPLAVRYAADRDLWKFHYPETKAFCAGIDLVRKDDLFETFRFWDQLCLTDQFGSSLTLKEVISNGEIIVKQNDSITNRKVKSEDWKTIEFEGYSTALYNQIGLISEQANAILTSTPIEVTLSYFFLKDGVCVFNMRSRKEIDVSDIAIKYGGGGHKNAASFKLPFKEAMEFLGKHY